MDITPKEKTTNTGFSLRPSDVDKLDAMCGYYDGISRSELVRHLIDHAHRELVKKGKLKNA
tara:strand:- start:641 stop:823 length:183 start_codon:yes stop_codon:yes gene_type:complete